MVRGALSLELTASFRRLAQSPAFTLLALFQITAGVSALLLLHSLLSSLILRPLPFKNQDRLVMLWEQNSHKDLLHQRVAPDKFRDWQSQLRSVENLAGFHTYDVILSPVSKPQRIKLMRITGHFTELFQLRMLAGRSLVSSDDASAVLITESLWRTHFGSRRNIIGSLILISGASYIVVGVVADANPPVKADVFSPLQRNWQSRVAHSLFVAGTLRPHFSIAQCQLELNVVTRRSESAFPDSDKGWTATVTGLRDEVLGDSRTAVLLGWIAALFVLLISCFNIAHFISLRFQSRLMETAIRQASGANTAQLLLSFVCEPLIITSIGTVLGLLTAIGLFPLVRSTIPADMLNNLPPITMDLTTVASVLPIFGVALLLTGVFPALRAMRLQPMQLLKGEGSTASRSNRLSQMLVFLEIALSVCLSLSAGSAVKSLLLLQGTSPGFRTKNIWTAQFGLPRDQFKSGAAIITYLHSLLETSQRHPLSADVAIASRVPFNGSSEPFNFVIEGQPAVLHSDMKTAEYRAISPGFFRVMNIPILSGRTFLAGTPTASGDELIINRAMAKRFWGSDPMGRKISINGPQGPWRVVVGVVEDTRDSRLLEEPVPEMYFPISREQPPTLSLIIRENGSSMTAQIIADIFRQTGAGVIPYRIQTVDALLSSELSIPRSRSTVLSFCGSIGLGVAVIGLYSFLSYSVMQRTREIGIRMALGATSANIVWSFLGEGIILIIPGIASGFLLSLAISKALAASFFGMDRQVDSSVFVVLPIIGVVTSVAIFLTARRAAKVDPVVALRYQ